MIKNAVRREVHWATQMGVVAGICLFALGAGSTEVQSFSFIHASDTHFSAGAESASTIGAIANLSDIEMSPFSIRAPRPDFAIVSGDLTEFGDLDGAWQKMLTAWEQAKIQHYFAIGNHDSTWRSQRPKWRGLFGATHYSFDHKGIHFIALESAGIQDPRPAFTTEEINWLAQDLQSISDNTPVIAFFHHPLFTSEFASAYDGLRISNLLHTKNIAAIFFGHGHKTETMDFSGIFGIEGGSTFNNPGKVDAGFNVIDVRDHTLRVAYKKKTETAAAQKVAEVNIPQKGSFPKIEVVSPNAETTYIAEGIDFKFNLLPVAGKVVEAVLKIDDSFELPLASTPNLFQEWSGHFVAPVQMASGAHFYRLTFKLDLGSSHEFGGKFYFERPTDGLKSTWRVALSGSVKGAPLVLNSRVFAGTTSGDLYCLDGNTGKIIWQKNSGAEILASPVATNSGVIVADGNGVVFHFDFNGNELWRFQADESVYGKPTLDLEGNVLFGTTQGSFYSLSIDSGVLRWRAQAAGYSIETGPFIAGQSVYVSAWDQKVHALDTKTGAQLWESITKGSREAAAAKMYYSPGDSTPVVSQGKVFVADRAFALSILDEKSGALLDGRAGVTAVSLSLDGQSVYLRGLLGALTKMDLAGHDLWSSVIGTDNIPATFCEKNDLVYAATGKGLLSVLDSLTGKQLQTYQVTPQLYMFAEPVVEQKNIYVVGYDGVLTCLTTSK